MLGFIEATREAFAECRACELWKTARRAVTGEGPVPCDWMFVGGAPGANENARGRPFVGQAGGLLDRLLVKAGLSREEVYITNLVHHCPPGNRNPRKAEITACLPFLRAEVESVQPKYVVVMGRPAVDALVPGTSLKSSHGKARAGEVLARGVTVVPWWHPAYALRRANIRVQMEQDAERLQREVEGVGVARPVKDYRLIHTEWELARYVSSRAPIAVDIETTSPVRGGVFQTDEAQLVGFSVSVEPYSAVYYPTTTVPDLLRYWLESPAIPIICHNTKFEWKQFWARHDVTTTNCEDTRLLAYLLEQPATDLKTLARQWLGEEPTTFKEQAGKTKMSELTVDEARQHYIEQYKYGCADSDHTLRLWEVLSERVFGG